MNLIKPFFVFFAVVCISIFASAAKAQICAGSLGDAVVNVTFGSGLNPGSPLPVSINSYNFLQGDCPNDGSYTITNSTSSCFNGSWHTITEDHTPNDVNGYMMLVNASVNPGVFYLDTVRNLCGSTTYEFGAWVVNVLKPLSCNQSGTDPKLVFRIETITGQVLGTYSTGDIPETSSPVWKQYGLFFTTPANTSDVVIRLSNSAPGGCGNDLALDDITFRPCGPTINAGPINSNSKDTNLCINKVSPVTISATIGSGFTLPASQWQETFDNGVSWNDIPGATSTAFVVNKTNLGKYTYRLTVAESSNSGISNCKVASNEVNITIHDLPVVSAHNNGPVCENAMLQLSASGGSSYIWQGPAGFTAMVENPLIASLKTGGLFAVLVTDLYGCTDTASTTVLIRPKPVVTASPDLSFCTGDSAGISASGGVSYLWAPSEGLSDISAANPVARPTQTTVYLATVTDAANCSDTASVKVTVYQKPVANAGADKILIKGATVVLNGTATGEAINYYWTPVDFLNDPLLLQPSATPLFDKTYTLHAESAAGCGKDTNSVFIRVFKDFYIPSAFSPDGDGKNDTWRMEVLAAYPNAWITVYNRLGENVFTGRGGGGAWDGKFKGVAAPAGVYVYIIDLKANRPLLRGTVMLIR